MRWLRPLLVATVALWGGVAVHAQEWADIITTNQALIEGRLCFANGVNTVLCNADSPTYVSSTGALTATSFSGDGSGLTGVAASSLVNGTTSITIPSANGLIGLDTNGSRAMTIHPNGQIHIANGSNNTDLLVQGAQRILIDENWTSTTNYDALILHDSSPQNTATGGKVGLRIRGGYNDNKSVGIYGVAQSNFANSVDMALYTGNTTNGYSEKVRISAGGNVGIGTTSPDAALDVSGSIQIAETGTETCAATSDLGRIRFNQSTGKMEVCRLP